MAGAEREQNPAQRHSVCVKMKGSDDRAHGCHRGIRKNGKALVSRWVNWHNLLSFNGFRAEKVLDTNQAITYFGML